MSNIKWESIKADAILITNPKNIRHFTNLQASLGFVVVAKDNTTLFVDSRYFEAARRDFDGEVVLIGGRANLDAIKDLLAKFDTVAFESDFVTVDALENLKKLHNNLVPLNGQTLRMVKSSSDIEKLQKAVNITKEVMGWAGSQLKPGLTEKELATKIINRLYESGSEKLDYPPIVAGGPNSALPHHKPTDRPFEDGDSVMFDFAAVVDGFTADLTRNYIVGSKVKHEEIETIREIVRKSQLAGIAAAKPGVTGADVDKVCRDIIVEAGYGEMFGHGTGHGLGRDVHELPNVAPTSNIEFEPGHVITVEPAIYLPGIGGIRIEDDVLITDDGNKVL